jgi:predicted RNA-binding protein
MNGWELVKTHNVYAFAREAERDKIAPGDRAVFYVRRSDPPVFVGAYEISGSWEEAKEPFWAEEKAAGKVIWPWRFRLNALRLGAVDARKLSKRLSFVENKDVWSVYLMGSLANFGRSIPESDFEIIFQDLAKPSIPFEVRPVSKGEQPSAVKRVKRRIPAVRGPMPGHNELRDMIYEIGLMKKLLSETEYPINDMKLDVAWRTPARQNPDHAWEVHIGGNFFEALAKLKHAWDLWKADPYLVTTERFEDETKKLLGGTFHEIKSHIRIINWRDLVRLYRLLREAAKIETRLNI